MSGCYRPNSARGTIRCSAALPCLPYPRMLASIYTIAAHSFRLCAASGTLVLSLHATARPKEDDRRRVPGLGGGKSWTLRACRWRSSSHGAAAGRAPRSETRLSRRVANSDQTGGRALPRTARRRHRPGERDHRLRARCAGLLRTGKGRRRYRGARSRYRGRGIVPAAHAISTSPRSSKAISGSPACATT